MNTTLIRSIVIAIFVLLLVHVTVTPILITKHLQSVPEQTEVVELSNDSIDYEQQ